MGAPKPHVTETTVKRAEAPNSVVGQIKTLPDRVIVVHVGASAPAKVSFTVKMDSPHENAQTKLAAADMLVLNGQVRDYVPPNELGERFDRELLIVSLHDVFVAIGIYEFVNRLALGIHHLLCLLRHEDGVGVSTRLFFGDGKGDRSRPPGCLCQPSLCRSQ